MDLTASVEYEGLIGSISEAYLHGRLLAHQAVNVQITETYWQIGRHIVEFEQGGTAKAKYGKTLLVNLAKDLSLRLGKGFSRSNLIRFRQFYLAFPIRATVSHELSWSHIVELLKIDDAQERGFYQQHVIIEKWSVRELVRQKDSVLFLRLAAGKDNAAIMQLAAKGQIVTQPLDILRDPYVFEFLRIP